MDNINMDNHTIGYVHTTAKVDGISKKIYWPCVQFKSWKGLRDYVAKIQKKEGLLQEKHKRQIGGSVLQLLRQNPALREDDRVYILLGDQLLSGLQRVTLEKLEFQESFDFAFSVATQESTDDLLHNHLRAEADRWHEELTKDEGGEDMDLDEDVVKDDVKDPKEDTEEAIDEPPAPETRRVSKSAVKPPAAKKAKATPAKKEKKVRPTSNDLLTPAPRHTSGQLSPPATKTPVKTPMVKTSRPSAVKSKATEPTPEPPSFDDVKKLLQKGGFVFRSGLFCRPNMDPKKNRKSRKGVDYFDSLAEFRSHLCAHGVGVDPDGVWTESEELLISSWVRYDIVAAFKLPKNQIPETYEPLRDRELFSLLRKLGFGWKRLSLLMPDNVLTKPGITDEEFSNGIGVFERREVYEYIARFGLPDECTFDEISDVDRLSLELFVCDIPREALDTFEYQENGWDFGEMAMYATSGVSKSAKKRDRSDESNGVLATPKRATSTSKRRRTKSESVSPSSPVQDNSYDSPEVTQASSSATVVSLTPEKVVPLPDLAQGRVAKLEACMQALGLSYNMGKLTRPRGSQLQRNLDEISGILKKQVDHHLKDEPEELLKHALYIAGPPGIGKTSGILSCIEAASAFARAHSDYEEGCGPDQIFINASSLTISPDPMSTFFRLMGEGLGINTTKQSAVERKLAASRKGVVGKLTLLVIDEIDMLVGCKDSIFTLLKEWTQRDNLKLVVIGISNSTGNDKFERLQDLLGFDDHYYIFKPYGEKHLTSILKERVGDKVFDPKAITFIAKKVANAGGDARKALELASEAASRCLQESTGADDSTEHIVTMKHVVSTVASNTTAKIKDLIEGLPSIGKMILCIVHTLASANITRTTILQMKKAVVDCMKFTGHVETVGSGEFTDLLEVLAEQGLIRFGSTGQKKLGGAASKDVMQMPIELDVQLDDIASILNKTLKHEFYAKLRDYASANRSIYEVKQ